MYRIEWSDAARGDLEEIFGDFEAGITHLGGTLWQLGIDPLGSDTWRMFPGEQRDGDRITRHDPHRGFPTIALSYSVRDTDPRTRSCLIRSVTRANVPELS